MPRINVRYDASVVRASELASLMPALADIGAEQYDTTPDKVVVELFAQGEFCLNHRTLDVEVSALPDPEGRREARIETFALALSDFLLDWMAKHNIAGAVGVERDSSRPARSLGLQSARRRGSRTPRPGRSRLGPLHVART